ncbi:hypothetical protein AAF712_014116 [Marasmius tenuissimus]|uniref:Catalase n=1 Tax=Marasmius tenuissimus TaxID=585030 RepID=A0ABR2ZDY7_9AGAR
MPKLDPPGSTTLARPPGDDGFLDQFVVDDSNATTTTDFGTHVDDTRSLKAGDSGPTLLEDFVLRTKITRFDHERIPERVVHARGAAAHGYFESYKDWSDITAASFLNKAGKQTPVFTRFSPVTGSRGSADTVRDVRGFAVRFYTDEGNFDLVGNNIPVFFIQDAIQFPDLIHAVKPRPDCEIPQAQTAHDSAYDFFAQNPSTLHTHLWAMSPHGIIRSYRHTDGFGVHTFRLVNAEGKSKLVKFHFKSLQGRASLIWPEAQVLNGQNPDFHREDLWQSIEAGACPEWEVCLQIMEEEDVRKFGFDLLDSTKLVPEELVPLTPIGKMVLNRNPRNYFAETEQVMYCIGHVVRGIDFTDDPLLQGRLFSYVDTQLNRNMGSPNFEQIPINRPRNEVHNNNRDGAMQQFIHTNNFPYTFNELNKGQPAPADGKKGNGYITAPARRVVDAHYVRELSPTFLDYWTQSRLFYNSLLPAEQQMVIDAFRFELSKVESMDVRNRFITHLNKMHNGVARKVAMSINVNPPDPDPKFYHDKQSKGLSVLEEPLKTIAGLRVGILASMNSKSSIDQANGLVKEFKSRSTLPLVIAEGLVEGVNAVYTSSDAVLYDGIIIVDGTEKLFDPKTSTMTPLFPPQRPLKILQDAYFYGKPVAAIGSGQNALSFTTPALTSAKPGVFVADNSKTVKEFANEFEEGLKKFKFTERFPMDD